MFGQTDPFYGYYEDLYAAAQGSPETDIWPVYSPEWVKALYETRGIETPDFNWMSAGNLTYLKAAWVSCGGASLFGAKFPDMPELIQLSLYKSLGTGETARPSYYRFIIPSGYSFYDWICTVVRDTVNSIGTISEIKNSLKNELESRGFTSSEALKFVDSIFSQTITAHVQGKTYEQQQLPDTYQAASVGQIESLISPPLLLIGAGILVVYFLTKEKKRSKK